LIGNVLAVKRKCGKERSIGKEMDVSYTIAEKSLLCPDFSICYFDIEGNGS
jgi:hypothetical protein